MKILAVDAGFDRQGSYRGYSANIAAAIPVRKGDEVAGQFQYIHYDGRDKFTSIPLQNHFLVEAGYYDQRIKIQPFLKYEAQVFASAAKCLQGYQPLRAGRQLLHSRPESEVDGQYLRALPRNGSSLKPANEFTVQLQFMYF